jgi:hypothetical protein
VSSEISAILLDAGGVLVFPQPDLFRPPLAALGVSLDIAAFERAHYQAMVVQDVAAAPPVAGTWSATSPPAAWPRTSAAS